MARPTRAALGALLFLALLHAWLHASTRPLFQVSDEISYLSALQQRIYATERAGTLVYTCAAPPDGVPLPVDPGGKALFQRVGSWALGRLCTSGLESTVVFWVLRLGCGLTLPLLVWVTHRLARTVAPDRPALALVAAAGVALQPMAATVSGGITPDSFANVLGGLCLLLATRLVLRDGAWWEVPVMIAAAAAALASKDTAAFLLPTVAVALAMRAWAATVGPQRRALLAAAVLTTAVVGATAVLRLLPPTALPAGFEAPSLAAVATLTATAASSAAQQAWSLAWSAWMPLGNFGASVLVLPPSFVVVPIVVAALAVVGLATTLLRGPEASRAGAVMPLWTVALALCVLQPAVREAVLQLPEVYQGRWLFPMLPALAVLTALGLEALGVPLARLLPLQIVLLGAVATVGLVVVAGYYYLDFPATIDTARLFLRSSSRVPLDMARLEVWTIRPSLLTHAWPFIVAGTLWGVALGAALRATARLSSSRGSLHG
jgi:hypothetical protein